MARDSLRERLREPEYARAYREYITSLVRRAQRQKQSTVHRGRVSRPALTDRL